MKNQLRLGDIVFDSRRIAFINSLKTVVCAGLTDALGISISEGLRGVVERVDGIVKDYKPLSLVLLGPFASEDVLLGVIRRWTKKVKLQIISFDIPPALQELAESYGCEVHSELIWDQYRFVESEKTNILQMSLLTVSGHPHYVIRVGNQFFGGYRLPVFLKGLGHLILPSFKINAPSHSIFRDHLKRYDVFAIGHSRVFPLGKVADIQTYRSTVGALPITKSALAGRLKGLRKKAADFTKTV